MKIIMKIDMKFVSLALKAYKWKKGKIKWCKMLKKSQPQDNNSAETQNKNNVMKIIMKIDIKFVSLALKAYKWKKGKIKWCKMLKKANRKR